MMNERGRLLEIPLILMAAALGAALLIKHPSVYLGILWPLCAIGTHGLAVDHRWRKIPVALGLFVLLSLGSVPLLLRFPLTFLTLFVLVFQSWLCMVLACEHQARDRQSGS